MKLNLFYCSTRKLQIDDINQDTHIGILPKHIQINTKDSIDIALILQIKQYFDPSILSFNDIEVKIFDNYNFEQLKILSEIAKRVTLKFVNNSFD